jgi:hypothetical protein
MEIGAEHGMWTFQRYQTWLESKKAWHFPFEDKPPDSEPDEVSPEIPVQPPAGATPKAAGKKAAPGTPGAASKSSGPIVIEPVEGGLVERHGILIPNARASEDVQRRAESFSRRLQTSVLRVKSALC